jgi:hypothetical protein
MKILIIKKSDMIVCRLPYNVHEYLNVFSHLLMFNSFYSFFHGKQNYKDS